MRLRGHNAALALLTAPSSQLSRAWRVTGPATLSARQSGSRLLSTGREAGLKSASSSGFPVVQAFHLDVQVVAAVATLVSCRFTGQNPISAFPHHIRLSIFNAGCRT